MVIERATDPFFLENFLNCHFIVHGYYASDKVLLYFHTFLRTILIAHVISKHAEKLAQTREPHYNKGILTSIHSPSCRTTLTRSPAGIC